MMKNIRHKTILVLLALMLALTGCSLPKQQLDEAAEALSEAASTADEKLQSVLEQAIMQEITDTPAGATIEDQTPTEEQETPPAVVDASAEPAGLLTSAADLGLTPADGKGKSYTFTYDGEEYKATYIEDHWKIVDSYKINDEDDMLIICQALIELHPIHGKDLVGYRTADDMVYEWEVHNLAYMMLSDDDSMKSHVKDVDFDPQDQNCSFEEIYYNHTGKELDLGSIFGG